MRTISASQKLKLTAAGDIPVDWQCISLSQVAKITSGGTPSKENSAFWGGDIPWISAKDLKRLHVSDSIERLTTSGAKHCKLVPPGTILILVRGMTLLREVPIAIASVPLAFNQDTKALQLSSTADPVFVAYQLLKGQPRLLASVDRAGHGTGRLPTELLETFPLALPPLDEQRAIAEILNEWEIAISRTESLVSEKIHQRRGLMQLLLTGKQRFSGFGDRPWRKLAIGELVRSEDRYAPFNDDKLYRLASIRRRSGGLFAREALYGREIKTKVLKEIREGDFIISRMQVVHGALGVVPSDFDRFYVSDSYEVLVLRDPASLDMGFFNYLSQTPAFYRLALVSSHGVHIEKMTFGLDDFLNEKVLVPPTIEEQRHISALLKESDDEISLLEKRSDALKEQKSGLMNRLLSGKIRLKR